MSKSPIADQLIALVKYRGHMFNSNKSFDQVLAASDGLEAIFRGLEYGGDLKTLFDDGAPKRKQSKYDGNVQQAGDRTPKYGTPIERPKALAKKPKSKEAVIPVIYGDSEKWNGNTLVIHSKINDILIDQTDPKYLQFTHRAAAEAENQKLLDTAEMTWIVCSGKEYHAKKTLKMLRGTGKAKGVILPKNADPKIKELYVKSGYRVEQDWEKSKKLIAGENKSP
uniref:YflT domain-containing protein n=1 Tax=Caenorhabditis tropicalis TaxID=1561998 RepID=A0A1I7UEI1_9PELO